jgi:hypothetical protein
VQGQQEGECPLKLCNLALYLGWFGTSYLS